MRIQYAVDLETGLVWSRVGDMVALPVLDYPSMAPANNFLPTYRLETFNTFEVLGCACLKWTRKIPMDVKNRHRRYWGMRLLEGGEAV